MEWKKIFANHISDKGVKIQNIFLKNSYNSTEKNQIIQFKKWAKDLNRHFSKEDT